MERLASSNVRMPAQKLRSLAYSLLRTWKETTISWGIHFWINFVCRPVPGKLSGKRWVLSWRRKSSAKCVLRTRKEAGRTWEVLIGWQWWPWRPAAHDDPFEDQAGVAVAGAGIHFSCVGGLCVTHLSRSGLVSCTWGWDDFRRGYLGRMWRHPWQSASVQTTLTHLLSWMPQELCTEIRSCLALQTQLYSSYKSRTTLKDLIGISPNGSIYFVSELWSGPISARELVIKSVMFSLSKKFYHHIHKQCYLSTFFLLSDFLHLLLVDSHDCLTSIMFCLTKKKNSNHRIHTHCSLSIPLFSNFFRVCWFGWLIHEHHVFF